MKSFRFFCLLQITLSGIKCLNYGQSSNLPSSASPFIQTAKSTLGSPNFSIRRSGKPYTIFYPLTFLESRGRKALNVSFSSPSTVDDSVKSRIMNQPELYPNFGYFPSPPVYPKPTDEEESQAQDFPNEYSDSNIKKVAPVPPTTFTKANIIQPIYYNTSKILDPIPDVDNKPPKVNFIPSLGYGKYIPPALKYPVQVSSKPVSVQQVYRPQVPVIKSRPPVFPPKYLKTKPKDTIIRPAPKIGKVPAFPSPKATYKKPQSPPPAPRAQQYQTCVCVPYYLCKNGILNSGGKLQDVNKRRVRSLNYAKNKTISKAPYNTNFVNLYARDQNSDQSLCESDKVCCQVFFDDVDRDDDTWPVATPLPEQSEYLPPRFPNRQENSNSCGTQRALGVQQRLQQVQYPADVAEFGEYPWQIAILKKVVGDKSLYLCGGVLVAPQWVATVAHCLSKYLDSPLLVRLGEWDVNRKDELYPYVEKDVNQVVVHPEFDPESLEADIALLQLVDPVDSNLPHVNPACLPSPGQIYEDSRCWVSGWGKNFFGPRGEYQSVLKKVDVPVVSRSLCSTQLRTTNLGPSFVLHPGFLCAGGEVGKDACTGDGGSPLVCKSGGIWYVVGLVSWGIGCGQVGVPGVYVNVLYYADWINSVIKTQ